MTSISVKMSIGSGEAGREIIWGRTGEAGRDIPEGGEEESSCAFGDSGAFVDGRLDGVDEADEIGEGTV